MPDRETLVEAGVAVLLVFGFIGLFVAVGASFGGDQLDPTGGQALVGGIVAFIVVMSVVGYVLDRWQDRQDDG